MTAIATLIGIAAPGPKISAGIGSMLWPDLKDPRKGEKVEIVPGHGQPEEGCEASREPTEIIFGHDQPKQEHDASRELIASLASQISQYPPRDAAFEILSSFYFVHDSLPVQRFLSKHRSLTKLLFAAFPRVKETWGSDAKTDLQLFKDPEDDSVSLVVYVNSGREDAYKLLDRFDKEWWLPNAGGSDGLVTFSVQIEHEL